MAGLRGVDRRTQPGYPDAPRRSRPYRHRGLTLPLAAACTNGPTEPVKSPEAGAGQETTTDVPAGGRVAANSPLAGKDERAGTVRDFAGDDPGKAWDYDYVRNQVMELAAAGRYNLQETLAEAVYVLLAAMRGVKALRVTTAKPDIYGDARGVGVEFASFNVAAPGD